MMDVRFQPLDLWPIPVTRDRRGSRHFKSGWNDTMDLLEKELRYLQARQIIIQIETTPDQIRNDGWPYSNARVAGPRVAIAFQSKFGPLTYRCDDCVTWIHNMRCIGMTLERLRMAEMYGVTKRGEQYQGFKALPAGGITSMGPEEAIRCVASAAGRQTGEINGVTLRDAYRAGSLRLHPDRPGGSQEAFQRLTLAYETLQRHWGVQ